MHPSARALLVVASALLAGCETAMIFRQNPDEAGVSQDDFVESDAPLKDVAFDALWDRAQIVVGMEGLGVDDAKSRFADRQLVTRWNTFLGVNRYEGYRTRTWIRFRQPTDGGWIVGVTVQRQRNTDIRAPQDPTMAMWENQPAERPRAEKVLWKIEAPFRPAATSATR
jgi:hypothetical protein